MCYEKILAQRISKSSKKYLKSTNIKNVNTDDFLKIVRQVSGYDVERFKQDWLLSNQFHYEIARYYLFKMKSLKKL